ncbi:MFS transporter [Pseudomonas sp. NPDC087342]|uniref:MFS transporter n=1 Tax=Pseudomonas sp. NPDC087342 TaxID=3364437 RepID=UPI0037F767B1
MNNTHGASAVVETTLTKPTVNFEDAPASLFHWRVAIAGTGGQFSDGFVLGIIGLALTLAAPQLHLDAFWMGILGAASLAGLCVGSLFAGALVDKIGRKMLFNYDMVLFAVISISQFWVEHAWHLLIIRVLLGLTLGLDYVVSKALVIEYAPKRWRGRMLSGLAIAWALGYACAYILGYFLKDHGPDIWRVMLATSAIPSLIALALRFNIPESPLWLQRKGRVQEANDLVAKHLGDHVVLPRPAQTTTAPVRERLLSRKWGRNLFIAGFFYMCLVIPYFALGTFSPLVFQSLNITDKFLGGLVYNVFLVLGTILGAVLVDRISRRVFLIGGFFIGAALLTCMTFSTTLPSYVIIGCFALFAFILSGTNNLCFVYPGELFPTSIRATALGVATAISRLGSAASTFIFPTIVASFGGQFAVFLCVAVLLIGGIVCALWAPETRHASMGAVNSER